MKEAKKEEGRCQEYYGDDSELCVSYSVSRYAIFRNLHTRLYQDKAMYIV